MANEMRDLLESVAQESAIAVLNKEPVLDVLTRRLLPLLEAGQAMRDWRFGHLGIDGKSLPTVREDWDAAKAKAMGGKP